jgi:hypothetical protein
VTCQEGNLRGSRTAQAIAGQETPNVICQLLLNTYLPLILK